MYSAEMYSDDGQAFDPPASLVRVRIRPPLDITQAQIDHNILGHIEIEHIATTTNASVYEVVVKGEPGRDSEDDHQERVAQAAHFIGGILSDVNLIDDLSSEQWADGLTRVGDISGE
jgi:hypothetical protein